MLLTANKVDAIAAFCIVFGGTLLIRLGCELIFRLIDPPTGVRPADSEDYSAEFAGVVVSSDRRVPTARERAPGVALATALIALSIVVCVAFFHELALIGVLLVIVTVVVALDSARVLTAHRMARPAGRARRGESS